MGAPGITPHDRLAEPPSHPADLPPAARRWLERAVGPGVEGLQRAELSMRGGILVGRWRRFRAHQVLNPGHDFTWSAIAGRGPLAVRGFDRYADGAGEMRWTVLGVPVMTARGPDVTRSAAGRLAGETVLSPAFTLGRAVRWSPSADDRHAVFRLTVGTWEHEVTITVDPDGRLTRAALLRWGDPDGTGYRLHPFSVSFGGEISDAGITIPRYMVARWWRSDGRAEEFFQAGIESARFR